MISFAVCGVCWYEMTPQTSITSSTIDRLWFLDTTWPTAAALHPLLMKCLVSTVRRVIGASAQFKQLRRDEMKSGTSTSITHDRFHIQPPWHVETRTVVKH